MLDYKKIHFFQIFFTRNFFFRCISDHGRETRFPFLDENVVEFLESLNVCVKVIFLCIFGDFIF